VALQMLQGGLTLETKRSTYTPEERVKMGRYGAKRACPSY